MRREKSRRNLKKPEKWSESEQETLKTLKRSVKWSESEEQNLIRTTQSRAQDRGLDEKP